MYTRCPSCNQIQNLTIEELHQSEGEFRCRFCSSMFDPLTYLTEPESKSESKPQSESNLKTSDKLSATLVSSKDNISTVSENADDELAELKAFFFEPSKEPDKPIWKIGFWLGAVLLFSQLIYFEGYALSQKPFFRTWVEKGCNMLGCRLPPYENHSELTVLHRSLTHVPGDNYTFKIVFSNQAAFRQPYPKIDLTLLNFAGDPFAHRLIIPVEYLPEADRKKMIEADAITEINLKIAEPKTKVGGFDFDFVY